MVFAALMVASLEARGVLENMIAHTLRDGARNAVRVYTFACIYGALYVFSHSYFTSTVQELLETSGSELQY